MIAKSKFDRWAINLAIASTVIALCPLVILSSFLPSFLVPSSEGGQWGLVIYSFLLSIFFFLASLTFKLFGNHQFKLLLRWFLWAALPIFSLAVMTSLIILSSR